MNKPGNFRSLIVMQTLGLQFVCGTFTTPWKVNIKSMFSVRDSVFTNPVREEIIQELTVHLMRVWELLLFVLLEKFLSSGSAMVMN